ESAITFQGANKFATLAVIGNVTISATGVSGRIEMEGSNPGNDRIKTSGQPATLNLVNQTVDGAGAIIDGDLTLNNETGTIEADVHNQFFTLSTGSNAITNTGTLQAIFGAELVIDSPVDNNGTIAVSGTGSLLNLGGSVTGTGSIDIGTGGLLDVEASVAGTLSFTGPSATIFLTQGSVLQGMITGAQGSDTIDVTSVGFSPGVHTVWQQNGSTGTLSLVNNGSTLATFTLSGQYTSVDFSASSDSGGETLIEVLNSPPPSGTTADLIMRDGDNGDYEIYDIGDNSILGAAELGQIGLQWQVAGVGGFNGSDTSDMILREDSGTLAGSFEVYDVSNN